MADATNLIHAGLPWNNPQKITVKADQYISQLVINRGLLNLLSNDYYLDLKSQRINQYIVDLIDPHVNDKTIHLNEQKIVDIIQRFLNGQMGSFIEGFGLVADTVYIIPYNASQSSTKNLNRIQNIIDACPRNLNGNTAIFALTPVVPDSTTSNVEYVRSISQYKNMSESEKVLYTEEVKVNLMSRSINLNGFYGGTLVFMGNSYFTCASSKNIKTLTTKESRLMLEEIQKDLQTEQNKQIIIKGNGNNNNCSIVSFNNCLCDTFIWNLKLEIYNSNSDEDERNENLPQKKSCALFFPANLNNDTIIGQARCVRAGAINKEDFSNASLLLGSVNQTLSGTYDEEKELSTINLHYDYLKLPDVDDSFKQSFFGNYLNINDELVYDELYTGASFGFWLSGNFYQNNVNDVPIMYSVNNEGNGFYIGLEKIATITNFKINTNDNCYAETSFAGKKRNDLNNRWVYWSIDIRKTSMETLSSYLVTMSYSNYSNDANVVTVLPNKLINGETEVRVNLPYLNFGNPIYFFGNSDIQNDFNIRNILLFNQKLTLNNINAIASLGIEDVYNFNDSNTGKTFINKMKGAIYAYNCPSVNVIECDLKKVQ